MRIATLCGTVDGMSEVVITHGVGVQTRMFFKTETEAKHYFLDVLGWYEDKGLWYEHESILPAFVAVPRFSHGHCAGRLNNQPSELQIGIWVVSLTVPSIRGLFQAFYYQVSGSELLDFDPILSIASPMPLRIGAVGAWPTDQSAVEAGQFFYDSLLETYGDEYFKRAVVENFHRELLADESRSRIPMDAACSGKVSG